MKIQEVISNNHKKALELRSEGQTFLFPYAKLQVEPSANDRIKTVYVDEELGCEAITYELESGVEGSVHLDHVLAYNRDPRYLREMLLYKLTLVAQEHVKTSPLSKREMIRRLGTSAAQFYRLLDQTNTKKSINQLLDLLYILDYDVELIIKPANKQEIFARTRTV